MKEYLLRKSDGWNLMEYEPVELLDTMGDDNAVCDAARVSFDKDASNYEEEKNKKLLKYLATNDHWSPYAHATLKFRIHGPIFIARQFQKHTVGFAWNEVSRRYVDNTPWFHVPDAWRIRPENMKQGSVVEGSDKLEGDVLYKYLDEVTRSAKLYRTMLKQDICPEQVRMLMPQSMMTSWIWTGSLYGFWRFFKLRSDSHAQYECHPYAHAVGGHIKDNFPNCWEALNNARAGSLAV